jgi:hypothetical protein
VIPAGAGSSPAGHPFFPTRALSTGELSRL